MRISDWSSDVCSSDLSEADYSAGRAWNRLPAREFDTCQGPPALRPAAAWCVGAHLGATACTGTPGRAQVRSYGAQTLCSMVRDRRPRNMAGRASQLLQERLKPPPPTPSVSFVRLPLHPPNTGQASCRTTV